MTLEQAIERLLYELDTLVELDEADGSLAKAIKIVVGKYYKDLKGQKREVDA